LCQSVNFQPCTFVRHFPVLHFQATPYGLLRTSRLWREYNIPLDRSTIIVPLPRLDDCISASRARQMLCGRHTYGTYTHAQLRTCIVSFYDRRCMYLLEWFGNRLVTLSSCRYASIKFASIVRDVCLGKIMCFSWL